MQAVMERGVRTGEHRGYREASPLAAGCDGARRRFRAWALGTAFVVCGAGMIPWVAFLAVSLPSRTAVPHWSLAWVGLDSMEAIGLFATGC